MSARAFFIQTLDKKHTLLFCHFFEHHTNTSQEKCNKWRAMNLVQRVQRDFELRSQQSEQSQPYDNNYHAKIIIDRFLEGCFLIHDVNISSQSLVCIYQRIQKYNLNILIFASFALVLLVSTQCNKVLASHILSQMVVHLVKEQPKDVKEFLLKPEETYAIVEQLIPNGQIMFVAQVQSQVKQSQTFALPTT